MHEEKRDFFVRKLICCVYLFVKRKEKARVKNAEVNIFHARIENWMPSEIYLLQRRLFRSRSKGILVVTQKQSK